MARSNFDSNIKHTSKSNAKSNYKVKKTKQASYSMNKYKKAVAALIAAIIITGSIGAYEISQSTNLIESLTNGYEDVNSNVPTYVDADEEVIIDNTTNNNENTTYVAEENEYSYMKTEEAENLYEEATYEIAQLLDSMNFDNDIQYFYAFYIYLNEGLFSESSNLKYIEGGKYIDDTEALGLDCIIDKDNNDTITSVCRHNDALFSDVLEKSNMGFEVYSTVCRLDRNEDDILNNSKPNHQITVVDYNGITTYFDITNGAVADNELNSSYCVNTPNKEIYYKIMPEDSLKTHGYITKYNTENNVDRIKELVYNDDDIYTESDIDENYRIAYSKMMKNQNLVDTFKIKYTDNVISNIPNIKNK